MLFELRREVLNTGKAKQSGSFGYVVLSLAEDELTLFHPDSGEILSRGLPYVLLE